MHFYRSLLRRNHSVKLVLTAGVSKVRPAGQIRPAKPFHPTRENILSIMKT